MGATLVPDQTENYKRRQRLLFFFNFHTKTPKLDMIVWSRRILPRKMASKTTNCIESFFCRMTDWSSAHTRKKIWVKKNIERSHWVPDQTENYKSRQRLLFFSTSTPKLYVIWSDSLDAFEKDGIVKSTSTSTVLPRKRKIRGISDRFSLFSLGGVSSESQNSTSLMASAQDTG